jgi:hypothetical protein
MFMSLPAWPLLACVLGSAHPVHKASCMSDLFEDPAPAGNAPAHPDDAKKQEAKK